MNAPIHPLHAELAKLRATNEELAAEVEYLRGLLNPLPAAWIAGLNLKPKEERVFSLLMSRLSISRECLLVALYGDEPEPEPKICDVYLSHLRRKLTPLGITIDNLRGEGWSIPADIKAKIRSGEIAAAPVVPAPPKTPTTESDRELANAMQRLVVASAAAVRLREESDLWKNTARRRGDAEQAAKAQLALARARIDDLLFEVAELRGSAAPVEAVR